MRCLYAGLISVVFVIIVAILVIIWIFEGPDSGGYDQIKRPMKDDRVSAFLGSYLLLLLLPLLLLFIVGLACFYRFRIRRREKIDAEKMKPDSPVAAPALPGRRTPPPSRVELASAPPAILVGAPVQPEPASIDVRTLDATLPRPLPPLVEFRNHVDAKVCQSSPTSTTAPPAYDSLVYNPHTGSQMSSHASPHPAPHSSPHPRKNLTPSASSSSSSPKMERSTGMSTAISTSSLSRARVVRAINQASKESAL